ncbi:MAG: hypothetical protein JSS66_08365 [Armatimonadetes bacterium]|nr:hypothetical protein [Armatimonadota bacterium]
MRNRVWIVLSLSLVVAASVALAQDQGVQSVIGNVFLQNTTPGTAQIGHATITGTFRAGQVFVQQGSTATIPVVGNSTAVTGNTLGGSFSVASPAGIAVRGTATSTTGSNFGVIGTTRSAQGTGVLGLASAKDAFGVWARNTNIAGPALVAENTASGGLAAKFLGDTVTHGSATVQGTFEADTANGLAMLKVFQLNASESLFSLQPPGGGPTVGQIFASSTFSGMILNSQNVNQVMLSADVNGVGSVTADIKNFVQPDPDDEARDIVYACVEGPEAAAYVRGTAHLVNGRAIVALPRHFQNVSVLDGMTVQVSPLSADSEGLAIIHKSLDRFEVRELRRGSGSYDFDWEVKAVRRGFTNYKVYRQWDDPSVPISDRAKAMEDRRENARRVYGITYSAHRP